MESALAKQVYDKLLSVYGPQKCFLEHMTPFQLLVATILSAQCTDKRVNMVTRELFKRWPDAAAFASCGRDELEQAIFTCGFYHAKAGHIIEASKAIVEQFHGEIPDTMEGLLKLPGVGRKTANVVLGDAMGKPGFPVDTHVRRLSGLIGLSKSADPAVIESDICAAMPPETWAQFSHLLIVHGRTRCPANRPDCPGCELARLCGRANAAKSAKTGGKMAKTNAKTKSTAAATGKASAKVSAKTAVKPAAKKTASTRKTGRAASGQ
jgi:endonuclease-3